MAVNDLLEKLRADLAALENQRAEFVAKIKGTNISPDDKLEFIYELDTIYLRLLSRLWFEIWKLENTQ